MLYQSSLSLGSLLLACCCTPRRCPPPALSDTCGGVIVGSPLAPPPPARAQNVLSNEEGENWDEDGADLTAIDYTDQETTAWGQTATADAGADTAAAGTAGAGGRGAAQYNAGDAAEVLHGGARLDGFDPTWTRWPVSRKALPFCCAPTRTLSKSVPFLAICLSACLSSGPGRRRRHAGRPGRAAHPASHRPARAARGPTARQVPAVGDTVSLLQRYSIGMEREVQ
eukprot:SAG22_NODE_327_length_12278_cov_10.550209_8_plen_226_part_00